MAFDPNRLYSLLLNTGLQNKDNPLYQVIYQLIGAIVRLFEALGLSGSGSGGGSLADQSYITVNNDTATLPNSRQAVAGVGIAFDTSVVNQFIIETSGVWVPLTDGDPDEADLIFTSTGECIMVFVP